jgi:Domain of unknown function (DUF4145)
MKSEKGKAVVDDFLKQCQIVCEVAKTAMKNKKSLSGDNFYGNKFHDTIINLLQSEAQLKRLVAASDQEESEWSKLSSHIATLKSTTAKPTQRAEALKQLRMTCQSELLPRIAEMTVNPLPETEQVLPMAVIQNTRGYIEKIVQQANGCYEHQWYDACAVMIRRLVETLTIELYEARGKSAEIQDNDGNYLMLKDLVDRITSDKSWNLSRETKQALPLLKSLGDRSAHNRRYLAKKADIDKVLHGLRVAADDLLHLSGLK